MIRFCDHPSPNPAKVALFLEEAGLPYELVPIDTRKGEQHTEAFTAINPNAKTPALVDFEAQRHWNLVDVQLATHRYMLGDVYTIVDMAVWGWARAVPFVLGAEAWATLPNVKRLLDEINARPAAQRAEALKTRHAFKTEMDDDARRNMFPQNARLAA